MKPFNKTPNEKISDDQRKSIGCGPFVVRERDPNEAMPRTTVYSGTYRTVLASVREGADDHLKYKSRGV